MEAISYKTVKEPATSLFKDRGSKFPGFIYPVYNEIQSKSLIEEVRKKYHDARHHCFAWRMGPDGRHYRLNDDGEPTGAAGQKAFAADSERLKM